MNIRKTPLLIVFVSLLSSGSSSAQDAVVESTIQSDPTIASDQFREISDLLREADRIKKVLSDNAKMQKQVTDLLTQNRQLTEAIETTQAENAKLAVAVKDVLAQNRSLVEKNEKLEASLEDVSAVEVQGLLLSEEQGSSTAILKISGVFQVVSEGDKLSIVAGANRSVGQTVQVKEIGKNGVQLEMVDSGKVVTIR
jgi:regulator of replication initiation timing